MSIWPSEIMTPLHVHGARSAREYEALQRRAIENGRNVRPGLAWLDPWDAADCLSVFISGGKWLVRCQCGNAPSAHPAWNIARCFECGAVYRHLVWPEDATRIEQVLTQRPRPQNRSWKFPESVEELVAQNLKHGIKV